jgi:hypothetical protein
VTEYATSLTDALDNQVAPALAAMGFERSGRRLAWTEGRLQIRAVVDSKANDPYRGGAFSLEFEVSDDGRFEEKLARRIDQVLDDGQRAAFSACATPSLDDWARRPQSISQRSILQFKRSISSRSRRLRSWRRGTGFGCASEPPKTLLTGAV